MIGYIYKTTNKINGKQYIGKKYGKFNEKYYGSGKLLKKAIEKYGSDNFIIEVIEYCESEYELNEKEIYHIQSNKPVYNIAKGGSGGNTLYNATNEFKNRIVKERSLKLSETWNNLSEEERKSWGKSISNSKKGKKCDRPNYKHSEETKKKIAESNKGWHDENWKLNHAEAMSKRSGVPNKKCWKKVNVNDKIYNSMREACEKLQISFPTLKKWIKNGKAKYE